MDKKKEEKKPKTQLNPPLNAHPAMHGAGEIAGAMTATAHDGDIFKAMAGVASGALSLSVARQRNQKPETAPAQASKTRSVMDEGKQKSTRAKKTLTTGPVITGPTR